MSRHKLIFSLQSYPFLITVSVDLGLYLNEDNVETDRRFGKQDLWNSVDHVHHEPDHCCYERCHRHELDKTSSFRRPATAQRARERQQTEHLAVQSTSNIGDRRNTDTISNMSEQRRQAITTRRSQCTIEVLEVRNLSDFSLRTTFVCSVGTPRAPPVQASLEFSNSFTTC